jgi:heme-degrading monooxygenase HmoA
LRGEDTVIVLVVTFESALSEDEVLAVARERLDRFRALPGLVQKYYIKGEKPNRYGGVYVWDSVESLNAYRASDLAASIPAAYKAVGPPTVQTFECMFPLRE